MFVFGEGAWCGVARGATKWLTPSARATLDAASIHDTYVTPAEPHYTFCGTMLM